MKKIQLIKSQLKAYSDQNKATILQRFFKTGKGEYGEGDKFIGVIVPNIRRVAKGQTEVSLSAVQTLLTSKIHEERLCALLILVEKYKKADPNTQKIIFDFYLANIRQVNNWDLVDLSAPKIVGEYLLDKPKEIIYKLAKSHYLWDKRVAIISTMTFIRNDSFADTLKIAEILIQDKHDLIQKAVGWMLREVGKKSLKDEENFLNKYYKQMPRTMLRYAIERFSDSKRRLYMN